MSEVTDVIKYIRAIAGSKDQEEFKILECEVISVNEAEKKCKVKPVNIEGTEIDNVKLQAVNNDGICFVPSIESMVVVALTNTKEPYVISTSDLDKIICTIDESNFYVYNKNGFIFNDGINGGLVNVKVAESLYKALDAKIDSLKTAVGTAISVYSGALDSGASAATFNALVLPTINTNGLEDEKIKH